MKLIWIDSVFGLLKMGINRKIRIANIAISIITRKTIKLNRPNLNDLTDARFDHDTIK